MPRPDDRRLPTVLITGGLPWCIAAGHYVFERLHLPADISAVEAPTDLLQHLRDAPHGPVVYVCGAATPRHFDGLERLRGEHPHAALVAASPEPDGGVAQHAKALGLAGYLHFDADRDRIVALLQQIEAGLSAFLPVETPAPEPAAPEAPDDPDLERRLQRLTRRERQVMELLGRGYANRDIAEALGLREGTIRIYVHRVIRQLGMRNRVDVALCASRLSKPA